jgi:hypothetical protein
MIGTAALTTAMIGTATTAPMIPATTAPVVTARRMPTGCRCIVRPTTSG